jgi:hypothetical protein
MLATRGINGAAKYHFNNGLASNAGAANLYGIGRSVAVKIVYGRAKVDLAAAFLSVLLLEGIKRARETTARLLTVAQRLAVHSPDLCTRF